MSVTDVSRCSAGPLVYAVALCPESYHDQVGQLGFNDSKALTEARRDELFAIMDADPLVGYATLALSPSAISQGMLRRVPHNLNAQSLAATVELIAGVLQAGVEVSTIYVDTLGDPERHRRTLQSHFNMARFKDIEWIVESKADAKYPVTGAASIAAKVTRDAFLSPWNYAEAGLGCTPEQLLKEKAEQEDANKENVQDEAVQEEQKAPGKRTRSRKNAPAKKSKASAPLTTPTLEQSAFWLPGSGYPADPNTSSYLQRLLDPVFGWPNIVRFSWATCKNLLTEKTGPVKRTPAMSTSSASSSARSARAVKRAAVVEVPPESEEPAPHASPFGSLFPTGSRAYAVRWVDDPPSLATFFSKSSGKKPVNETDVSAPWERASRSSAAAQSKARTGLAHELGLQPTTLGFL